MKRNENKVEAAENCLPMNSLTDMDILISIRSNKWNQAAFKFISSEAEPLSSPQFKPVKNNEMTRHIARATKEEMKIINAKLLFLLEKDLNG